MVPGDQTMAVLNPATEEVLAQCPRASKSQLDTAVAAAKAAFPAWAATPIEERRRLVGKMADVIEANSGELARLLTAEPRGLYPRRSLPPRRLRGTDSAIRARASSSGS